MKIDRLRTVRLADYKRLFLEIHADGLVELGQTFHGIDAVDAHRHAAVELALIGSDATLIERRRKPIHATTWPDRLQDRDVLGALERATTGGWSQPLMLP